MRALSKMKQMFIALFKTAILHVLLQNPNCRLDIKRRPNTVPELVSVIKH